MTTSRRSLIKLGLYATAGLVSLQRMSGLAWAAQQEQTTGADDGAWLRRDMFEAAVGQDFTVYTEPSGSVSLRLTEVEDCLSARIAGTVGSPNCFNILLKGSSRTRTLAQGSYRVQSPTIGTFQLFLVPGAVTKQGVTYSATFNRVTI